MEEEDSNQKVHQPDQDEEEEEETLSFCDLPIYSNGTDDYSVSASSSSLDDSEMDMFEFLSRDTSIGSSEKSIIFCGKMITYKESEQFDDVQAETEVKEEQKTSKRRGWSLSLFIPKSPVNSKKSVDRESKFASNSNYRTTSSTQNEHNTGESLEPDASRNQQSSTKKSGFTVRKPSVLSSMRPRSRSRSRSRWNLIRFGLLKFPSSAAEMELSDIRSRQHRRNPAGGILTPGRGGEKMKTMNGLWSLIRSLSCSGGGLAVTAIVPAFQDQ